MLERSSTGVRVFSVDKERVVAAVERWVASLRSRHPEIERVIWFGSWAHGTPHPGSDVDLCIVLTESEKSYRERLEIYAPEGMPFDVEVFPYTRAELDELARERPGWYAEIARGRDVPARD